MLFCCYKCWWVPLVPESQQSSGWTKIRRKLFQDDFSSRTRLLKRLECAKIHVEDQEYSTQSMRAIECAFPFSYLVCWPSCSSLLHCISTILEREHTLFDSSCVQNRATPILVLSSHTVCFLIFSHHFMLSKSVQRCCVGSRTKRGEAICPWFLYSLSLTSQQVLDTSYQPVFSTFSIKYCAVQIWNQGVQQRKCGTVLLKYDGLADNWQPLSRNAPGSSHRVTHHLYSWPVT